MITVDPVVVTDVYDLALTKDIASSGPYALGDTVEFTITVTNEGNVPSGAFTVVDSIPTWLMYSWTNLSSSTEVIIDYPSIPVNGSHTESVSFTIDSDFAWASITNVAEIKTDNGDDIDSTPWDASTDQDDDDSETIVLEIEDDIYDLALVKGLVWNTTTFVTWQTVEFTITVTNQGNVDANTLQVRDYVPAGLNYVSTSGTEIDVSNSTSYVDIDFAPLAAWASVTETIIFTVLPGFVGSTIVNGAEIIADDGGDIDSTTDTDISNDIVVDDVIDNAGDDEDDHDIEIITIINSTTNTDEFDLALQLFTNSGSSGTLMVGDTVTFDIKVTNQGDLTANGIQVIDYIPAWLTYVSSSAPELSATDSNVILDFGSLAPWAMITETITFIIDSTFTGTSIDNFAEIIADNWNDIDSITDTDVSNDVLLDDEVNNANNDEDDHDIETIIITQVTCVETGAEICDGIDNDCDGEIDEGTDTVVSCSAGQGECLATGTQPNACIDWVYVLGTCSAVEWTPSNEICEDALDNDCDGLIDEIYGCICSWLCPSRSKLPKFICMNKWYNYLIKRRYQSQLLTNFDRMKWNWNY